MDRPRCRGCAGRGRLRFAQRFGPVAPYTPVAAERQYFAIERQHVAFEFLRQPVHLRWAAIARGRHALDLG
jgi:hypothetical protein